MFQNDLELSLNVKFKADSQFFKLLLFVWLQDCSLNQVRLEFLLVIRNG